jgi:hypothetical protein
MVVHHDFEIVGYNSENIDLPAGFWKGQGNAAAANSPIDPVQPVWDLQDRKHIQNIQVALSDF